MSEVAATTPPNAPTFGSFTLLAKLARGDIGDLFLARSLGAGGFEKLVVIKRIHPEFTRDPEIAQLFLEEARTAARVEHPNVRIVYEIGQNQNHYYIALEYLEGVPLVDVLLGRRRQRRLADSRLFVALLAQACQGLHAAHVLQAPGGGLVHGDINPRSIFVTATGTTKILDFDIVEMRGALANRHGFIRRTNAYLSPEEVRTGHCDQRSDIFSMGVVTWECLTGRRLFKHKTRDETLAAIEHGTIPSAKSLRPELSDELNATVMRAVNRDPSLRFGTASDFSTALERAALSEGPPLTPVNIAALMEHSFASEFAQQKQFVRTARQGLGPALTTQHGISEQDIETRVAADPATPADDWAPQTDAATRVVQYDDSLNIDDGTTGTNPALNVSDVQGARDRNPFKDVSANADFSQHENTPEFQDTKNLVLSEMGVDSVDPYDDEPAAVRLDDDNAGADYQKSAPTSPFTDQSALPRMPSTLDPTLPRRPSTVDPNDARLSTIAPAESDIRSARLGKSSSAKARKKARQAAKRGGKKKSKNPLVLFLLMLMLGAAAMAAMYLTKEMEQDKGAQGEQPPVLQPSASTTSTPPTKRSGAGAAAGILAAANDAPETLAGSDSSPALEGGDAPDHVEAAVVPEDAAKDETKDETVTATDTTKKARDRKRAKDGNISRTNKNRKRKRKRKNSGDTVTVKPPPIRKPASKEPGYLTVSATPYATVFIDGKKRGITPLVKLKLAPGTHRLKLVSSADGKQKWMSIRILSADEVRRKVTF